MCGRFTLTWEEWRQVAGALGVENEGEAAASYRPRFNIAPTDEHFIITSEFERRKRAAPAGVWSIVGRRTTVAPASASTPKPKRSNSEQPSAKRFGSAAASYQPMAFTNDTGPKAKREPLWIHPRAGRLLLFAGLYESWYPEGN